MANGLAEAAPAARTAASDTAPHHVTHRESCRCNF